MENLAMQLSVKIDPKLQYCVHNTTKNYAFDIDFVCTG